MISVKLQGGYGNQQFQVAAAIGLADKLGTTFGIYDELRTTKLYKINHFKGRAPIPEGYQPKKFFKENPDQEYHELPLEDDICLTGYFQSYKYFDHCLDLVRAFFKAPTEIKKEVIGIHVRKGDYLKFPGIFPIIRDEYYIQAIENFIGNGYRKFELYYDEQETKEQFAENVFKCIKSPYFWIEAIHGDPEHDFKSLCACEHKIIANSSFSAMAAILSSNPDQIVIRPKEWLHTKPMTYILPKTENYIEL